MENHCSKSFSFFLYILIFCLLVTFVHFPCHLMLNQNGSPFFNYVSFSFYLSFCFLLSGHIRKTTEVLFKFLCWRCSNNSPSVCPHKDRLNWIWMEHKSRNLWWFLILIEKKSLVLWVSRLSENVKKEAFSVGLA